MLTSGSLTERVLGVSPVPVRSVPPLSPTGNLVRLTDNGVPVWSGPPGRITEVSNYAAGRAGPHGS